MTCTKLGLRAIVPVFQPPPQEPGQTSWRLRWQTSCSSLSIRPATPAIDPGALRTATQRLSTSCFFCSAAERFHPRQQNRVKPICVKERLDHFDIVESGRACVLGSDEPDNFTTIEV